MKFELKAYTENGEVVADFEAEPIKSVNGIVSIPEVEKFMEDHIKHALGAVARELEC